MTKYNFCIRGSNKIQQLSILHNNNIYNFHIGNVGHFDYGPAVLQYNGRSIHFEFGEIHNLKGPAVVMHDKFNYFIHNVSMTKEKWEETVNFIIMEKNNI